MEFFKGLKRIWFPKAGEDYRQAGMESLYANPEIHGDSGNVPHVISEGLHLASEEKIYACPFHDAMQRSGQASD